MRWGRRMRQDDPVGCGGEIAPLFGVVSAWGFIMKRMSVVVAALVAGAGMGVPATAEAAPLPAPARESAPLPAGVPDAGAPSATAPAADPFVGVSVPDIKARIRKADATKMSSADRACVAYVKKRMPSWWGPSGHTVVCRPGTTKGYDFYFDGVAVLTVNTKVGRYGWDQAVPWAASQVAATERLPLSEAPKLCRKAIAPYARLATKIGKYRIRCVSQITWDVPKTDIKDAAVFGYIQYAKREIAILETRDAPFMSFVTAHELGHAVSYMPKAGGLRTEVTKFAKRRTFTSDPYVGMPAEVWAESYARYLTGRNVASVQKTRLTPAQVDRLLRKYGLPRR